MLHQRELARYYQMPKEFVGPQAADDLISMHEALRSAESSWSYLFVAGSAAAESGLMATHLDESERHARLETANRTWTEAQHEFFKAHIEDDWSEGRRYTIPDRIEMNRAYLPLYHDMVDGAVMEETIASTHARLVSLAVANVEYHDIAEATGDYGTMVYRRGLAYEMSTLLTGTRLRSPSFFTIPVPARADHGEHFPERTHDVRLIQQTWGTIRWSVPYEVKPSDNLKNCRYESALVRGRVELLMPSCTEPWEIARYMQQEVDGTISAQHLAELDEITSRVLRLALEYKRRQSLAGVALSA